jgi:uncharacterized membrane protein YtjA (UPF0391 family)
MARNYNRHIVAKAKMSYMIKWILSFSIMTSVSGLIAFSKVAGPASGFAKLLFLLIVLLFLMSIIQAIVKKQWK